MGVAWARARNAALLLATHGTGSQGLKLLLVDADALSGISRQPKSELPAQQTDSVVETGKALQYPGWLMRSRPLPCAANFQRCIAASGVAEFQAQVPGMLG